MSDTTTLYKRDTSRMKIRPYHIKVMVFRPLIWAVESIYTEEEEDGEIAVWPISVYTESDGF